MDFSTRVSKSPLLFLKIHLFFMRELNFMYERSLFFVCWLLLNFINFKKVIFGAVEKVTKSCPQIEICFKLEFFC